MSVGTNENVKKVNEIENVNNVECIENTGGRVTQDTIDMQATQRLDFLGELIKESEKVENDKQGNFAPQNAQAENYSAVENPSENVHENPVEIEEKINTQEPVDIEETKQEEAPKITMPVNNQVEEQNTAIEVNDEANDQEEQQKIKMAVNGQAEETKITMTTNPQMVQENEEEVQKKKEKQHAQDKKDFRLERMLFARINVMQGKIKESLELIQKFERINAKEENLPNIVTTLHDKLTQEVIKQFRTVGIEFNMKSYLVQAIVSDLLCKFEEGVTEFKDCSENLNFVREVQEDFESRVELAPTSKVKNFFARIRGMFKPERKQEKLEELERERQEKKLQEANIHLLKYKYINSELEKYTIKNNIVNSLSKEILYGQGSGLTLSNSEFIEEKIKPEMKKLGLDNLLPNLEDKMYNEFKQKVNGVNKEEFEKMSIGDIRKNMRGQGVAQTRITQTVNMNNSSNDDEVLAI